jgi:hypothetical protein
VLDCIMGGTAAAERADFVAWLRPHLRGDPVAHATRARGR